MVCPVCGPQVRLLLDAGGRVNAGLVPSGLTALMMASKDGHTEVTQLLLDRGADPTAACSDDHSNALMLAASWGHIDTVQLLASFGTDVDARTVEDETACDFATESGMLGIADWLGSVDGWAPLRIAAGTIATSTSFWTISRAFGSSTPPYARRVLRSTWCPCWLGADWVLIGACKPMLWPIWGFRLSPPRTGPHRAQARSHRPNRAEAGRSGRRRRQRGGRAVAGLEGDMRGHNDARTRGDGTVVARPAFPVPPGGQSIGPGHVAGGGAAAAAAPQADGGAARAALGAVAHGLQFLVPKGLASPSITVLTPP